MKKLKKYSDHAVVFVTGAFLSQSIEAFTSAEMIEVSLRVFAGVLFVAYFVNRVSTTTRTYPS